MKNVLITLILLFAVSAGAQTIRRVNNNPGITGTNIYTTIQAAHDAAVNGDIIYVEPSNVNYGGLICTKNLRIYGNGYFLNLNIQLQNDTRSARTGTISLRAGSDGTIISGLDIDGIIEGFGVSNITVTRNRCKTIDFFATRPSSTPVNFSNLTIIQNYVEDPGVLKNGFGLIRVEGTNASSIDYFGTNILVANNFIGRDISTALHLFNRVTNVVARNNVIDGRILIGNASFQNNIITSAFGLFQSSDLNAGNYAANSVFLNNAASGNTFPSGYHPSNLNNINPNDHFEVVSGASPDSNRKLKATSTLKTAGVSGVEVGMFGGDFPYVVSGIPAIPSFSVFNTSSVGSNTTPLSVTISTKSNN
jgi:hypothetical protein